MREWVNSFNIVDIHILCVILLFIMYSNIRRNADLDRVTFFLFSFFTFTTILSAVADAIAWMADGRSGLLNLVANSLYFFILPLPSITAYYLSLYLARGSKAFTRPRLLVGGIIYLILFALSVMNLIIPTIFSITENLTYERAPFAVVYSILVNLILVLTIISVYNNRSVYVMNVLARNLFWLPPVIAVLLQTFFFGVNLYVAGLTVSIFIFYIGLQSRTLRLDYLTGAFNRRYFEAVILQKIRQGNFSMILVDVDGFKQINDKFGHVVGDEVLISVASLLKVSVHKTDTVARYGGDEFVVLIDTNNPEILKLVIDRIQSMIDKFNTSNSYPFLVTISMGYDTYRPGVYRNSREFIKHVDHLMYQSKKSVDHQLPLITEHE